MAINASRRGSGLKRPGPTPSDTGQGSALALDPVAVMPERLASVAGPIARIQTTRVIGQGWKGVGLRLHAGVESLLFEVFLTAGDGRDLVVAVIEEDEAVATWRGIGRSSMLPLLLETDGGGLQSPYPQIGAVALGQFHYRRQHSFLRHRRPRFLARRKLSLSPITLQATPAHVEADD